MGALLMSEEVYQGLANGAAPDVPIGHGFTYSGHPVSAAVGLEVLRLYTDGGILANGQAVGPVFAAGLQRLKDHPLVGEVRGVGLLGALELVADRKSKRIFGPELRFSERLFDRAYQNGVIFRAFGDGTIGLAPALCCTASEMEMIFDRIATTLDDLLEQADIRAAMG
jgi:adenosylmethionine-8-amino-7-oxononanoate aminotransferase